MPKASNGLFALHLIGRTGRILGLSGILEDSPVPSAVADQLKLRIEGVAELQKHLQRPLEALQPAQPRRAQQRLRDRYCPMHRAGLRCA